MQQRIILSGCLKSRKTVPPKNIGLWRNGNLNESTGNWKCKNYKWILERISGTDIKKVIPYQWDILNDKVKGIEKSHAIDNFRIAAGISNDKFYGEAYQDSDLYKWLEAVGNALQVENNIELEKRQMRLLTFWKELRKKMDT